MHGSHAAFTAGPDLGDRIMVELTHVRVKGGNEWGTSFQLRADLQRLSHVCQV